MGQPSRSTASTPTAAQLTRRDNRTARATSAASAGRPDALSTGRSLDPSRGRTPRRPSRTPSAPANAASTTPAFGLGCRRASARHTCTAPAESSPRTTASAAVSRAPGQPARSSSRAAAQPKRRYRGERWPTIASRVLTARKPTRPGTPATAPHSRAPTTASEVFSATDSTTARASCGASSACGSRPHRFGSSRRARSTSPAVSAAAIARASRPANCPRRRPRSRQRSARWRPRVNAARHARRTPRGLPRHRRTRRCAAHPSRGDRATAAAPRRPRRARTRPRDARAADHRRADRPAARRPPRRRTEDRYRARKCWCHTSRTGGCFVRESGGGGVPGPTAGRAPLRHRSCPHSGSAPWFDGTTARVSWLPDPRFPRPSSPSPVPRSF